MPNSNPITLSIPIAPTTIPVPVSPTLKADLEQWAQTLSLPIADLLYQIVKTQVEQWQYYHRISSPPKKFQDAAHLN